METIAILMTCYNRVQTTLHCIENLYNAELPDNIRFEIFLVDDNSPDQTGNIVKQLYPEINVIMGIGNLYWNKGMRLAWENATKVKDYDYYLWLNDDTIIFKNAFNILFTDYYSIGNRGTIIAGVCCSSNSVNVTYGGKNKKGKLLIPNGKPQRCDLINGNFTLISKRVADTIGILSSAYTHSKGDYDYGLRAEKAGFKCYTTSEYIGKCDRQEPEWLNPEYSLFKRIKILYSVKGIYFPEYIVFRYKHYGLINTIASSVYIHLKVMFRIRNKHV